MRTALSITLLLPTMVMAQRIVPAAFDVRGEIATMLEYEDRLLLGGWFTVMGEAASKTLVAWSPDSGVEDLASGITSGIVRTMVGYDGGVAFSVYGSAEERHVFFLAGTEVSELGTFSSGSILAMCVWNGDLYVAGSFPSMDGVQMNGVARWNGSAWSALGSGLNGTVYALAVHQGLLNLGGDFTATANGTTELSRLARWNGAVFESVHNGLDGSVRVLLSKPEALWCAGYFQHDGSGADAIPRFARVDDLGISALNPDANTTGWDLALVDLGPHGVYTNARTDRERLYQNGAWVDKWIPGIACAAEFQGAVYVSGSMMGVVPNDTLSFAKVLPGDGHGMFNLSGVDVHLDPNGSSGFDFAHERPSFVPEPSVGANVLGLDQMFVVGYEDGLGRTSCFSPFTVPGRTAGPRCNQPDETFRDRFLRLWHVDPGMLWHHAAHWDDPGYEVPEVIASWPAHGNTGNGEPGSLMPFQDHDSDGYYDPTAGDLPVMRGEEAVLMISSDEAGDTDPMSSPPGPSGFDSYALYWGSHDPVDSALRQTIFCSYTLMNRSDRYYDSVSVAMFTYTTLGNKDDNWIGCDPVLDMFYVYNADAIDQGVDPIGFGAHPPAFGVVGLNAPLRSFVSVTREWPSCATDPTLTVHAIQYSEGSCVDGASMIDPVMEVPTRYEYSEYPDVAGGFSMAQQGQFPGNYRGIASFGPFYDVGPGERICFDMAFVYARDTTQDNIQNTRVLQQKVIALKEWYAQQGLGCDEYATVGLHEAAQSDDRLHLFPNPASNLVTARRADTKEALVVTIHSSTGQLVWSGQWPKSSASLTVDVRALTDGVYLFRARGAAGQQSQRLVVAR